MVEPHLTKRRRRPSRATVIRRRLTVLVLVGGFATAGVYATTAALKKGDDRQTKTTPTAPVAVRKVYKIVFPEGFTRNDMAARVAAVDRIARRKRHFTPVLTPKQYFAATSSQKLLRRVLGTFQGLKKGTPLEGFLFPSTYALFSTDPAPVLVQRQLVAFERAWKSLDLRYARSKHLTPYDVLIIASMIEKEAVVADERPLISAVIYNRLHARMPLGIDATIRYALNVPGTRSLTKSELANPTGYNTRVHTGLPPTPIANPGLASMQAAARPAKVKYLYFVAKPDKKHHFFTASQREFNAYLAKHGYGPHP